MSDHGDRPQTIEVITLDAGVPCVEIRHGKDIVASILPKDMTAKTAQEIRDFLREKAGYITNPDDVGKDLPKI